MQVGEEVVLGLREAVGLPWSFAGACMMWWGCGGASVGARGARGGKYIPASVLHCDMAIVTVLTAMTLME